MKNKDGGGGCFCDGGTGRDRFENGWCRPPRVWRSYFYFSFFLLSRDALHDGLVVGPSSYSMLCRVPVIVRPIYSEKGDGSYWYCGDRPNVCFPGRGGGDTVGQRHPLPARR
jgi:hypothetical protein